MPPKRQRDGPNSSGLGPLAEAGVPGAAETLSEALGSDAGIGSVSASLSGRRRDDEPAERSAWVVRAGTGGLMVAHNLAHNVVSVDWDDWTAPDLSRFVDRDAYRRYSEEHFGHRTDENSRASAIQLWRFYHGIRVGDIVVMPLMNHGSEDDWIAIGRVTGDAERGPAAADHAKHHRSVEWLAHSVPKSDVEGDLRSSIQTPPTVQPIRRENAVRRLLSLAAHGIDPGPDGTATLALSGDEAGVIAADGTVVEGAVKRVPVNRYERKGKARECCIAVHGTSCQVCGIDLEAVYGEFANGYIHVHHITPVHQAAADGEYELDPINHLVPVCPNCHAMLHEHPDKPCSVEKLRQLMRVA